MDVMHSVKQTCRSLFVSVRFRHTQVSVMDIIRLKMKASFDLSCLLAHSGIFAILFPLQLVHCLGIMSGIGLLFRIKMKPCHDLKVFLDVLSCGFS